MFKSEIIYTKEQYEKYYSERCIYRKELEEIMHIMKTSTEYKILILGPAGSGKTTLLHMLRNYTEFKEPIDIISANDLWNTGYFPSHIQEKKTLFIDGIDEIQNPYHLLQQFDINKCKQLICTSRVNISNNNYFTHIIILKPLTFEQINDFVTKFGVDSDLIPLFMSDLNTHQYTPRDILSLLLAKVNDSNLKDFYSKYNNLLYQFGNGVDFSSGIILPKKELIVPSKEITTSVTIVNDKLLKQAQQDPKIMYAFTPREFEIMICEMLEKQGYNVKLTKQTRDGGKDIIIIEKSLLGEFCILVECKRYNINNPISVKLVRELYGTVEAEDATAGMFITTSYFTKDAKEFRQKIKHRMTLKDYNDLVQELNNLEYRK